MKAKQLIPLCALTVFTVGVLFFAGKLAAKKAPFTDVFDSIWLNLGYNAACITVFGVVYYSLVRFVPTTAKNWTFVKLNLAVLIVTATIMLKGLWLNDFVSEFAKSAS